MITVICVGKVKEKFYRDAILEYQKRLTKYTKLEIVEVDDYNSDNKEICLSKEKDLIMKHIKPKAFIITMEIEGQELSSVELSKKIDNILLENSNLTFIIGGSYGLDASIKQISNFKLSFSKLTYPHQLFRVILLEQIYRSFKILNNETYHK